MFEIIFKILETIGAGGLLVLVINWLLNKKRNTIETANLVKQGEILKFELKTNLDTKINEKTKELQGEIDRSVKKINDLNIVIAQMAIDRIKDDNRAHKKMAEMNEKIEVLIIENQKHIEREMKCLERLGELSKKFGL
jgi:hypothetical protein